MINNQNWHGKLDQNQFAENAKYKLLEVFLLPSKIRFCTSPPTVYSANVSKKKKKVDLKKNISTKLQEGVIQLWVLWTVAAEEKLLMLDLLLVTILGSSHLGGTASTTSRALSVPRHRRPQERDTKLKIGNSDRLSEFPTLKQYYFRKHLKYVFAITTCMYV